ncbi:hypothetical protein L4D76_14490 [Photobacterium sagamiensis]|uniref:hypothetical protein n=1 Tax=Photobacterium sagamiensis TaxID=2910241 RepID=UPI003D0E6ADC
MFGNISHALINHQIVGASNLRSNLKRINIIPSIGINEYKQAIRLNQATNIESAHDLYATIISVLKQINVPVPSGISEKDALEKLHGALALIGPYQLSTGY